MSARAELVLFAGAALATVAAACGGGPGPVGAGTTSGTGGVHGTGGTGGLPATTTTAPGGSDAGPDIGQPSTTYPAPHPAPPVVKDYGGPVLSSPKIVPVFFANDSSSLVKQNEDFLGKVGSSQYWAATTAEYGVAPAVALPTVHLEEDAPSLVDDSDIQSWIVGKLQAGDSLWPAHDPENLYVIHYPAGTRITANWGSGVETSCQTFGGYHSAAYLDAAHLSEQVIYAVIPRCGGFETSGAISHELIEAVTDPLWNMYPAYALVDDAHFYYELYLHGAEVGDMCAQDPTSFTTDTDVPYTVQRTWSNQAVLASHDPCVPAPAGEVYFNAAPVLPDKAIVPYQGRTIRVPAVKIAAGETRTIEVDLFSDGDTGGPWNVDVQDIGYLTGQPSGVDYSLDAYAGQNGQKLHLTISVGTPSNDGYEPFMITSSLGCQTHYWLGLVAN